MRTNGEGKANVHYLCHKLEMDDTHRHIATSKQCTRLAMTWSDRISFVLTEKLAIKGVKPLDMLKEGDPTNRNDDERFDGEFC